MPLIRCPHCGYENFTMEGWEDLDHCSSCGKPLGEPIDAPIDATIHAARRIGAGGSRRRGAEAQSTRKPRRA
jgi:DNA-directed RNA polymerase subunit RPC12/RpoP